MSSRTNQETSNVEKYERKAGPEQRLLERFRATLVSELTALGPQRVLDAGCGEGIVAGWVTEALPGVELQGVDARDEAIGEFRRRNPGAGAKVGDLYDLPFTGGEFDLVMAVEVLEHFERPRAALRELVRVSSGSVLLTVPHEPFFRGGNLLRGRYVSRLGSTPGHVNAWTRGGFLRMARTEVPAPRWWSSFPWQGITASAAG